MQYPENFTDGLIDDISFRKAFDEAAAGKSMISVNQALKLGGASPTAIELHAEKIYRLGRKERSKQKRPHLIIAWAMILGGIAATVLSALFTNRVYYATLILSAFGVGLLVRMKD